MPEPEAVPARREKRRGEILRAARAIVADGGLQALTIGALERSLGYTRGVITYHFDGKDEIVDALLDESIREIDEATSREVRAETSAADKVVAALRGMVQGFLDRREAGRVLISFWARMHEDPRLAAKNAALYAGWRDKGAALLRHGRATGELAAHDVDAMAALLVGIVIGVVTQVWFEAGAIDPHAVVEEAARAVLARLAASPPAAAGPRATTRRGRSPRRP